MTEYFANKSGADLAHELTTKIDAFDLYLDETGVIESLRESYRTYYGNPRIESGGENGELQEITVNHYASLLRSIHSMVTSNKIAWECRATNTDAKSMQQTILGASLLDYYAREKRMARYLKNATEIALFLKEAWVATLWDVAGGEMYDMTPTGAPVYEGDVQFKVFKLPDVIRDITKEDTDYDWIILREYKNKYDLAAKYPEMADQIISLGTDTKIGRNMRLDQAIQRDSDLVPLYTFFHKKTEALPNGRMVEYLGSDLITLDTPLPFRRIPVHRISAADCYGTAFGHSPGMDLLPLQKALDLTFSTILTNQAAFGVQNIMSPKGSNLSVSQIGGGMNHIQYDLKAGPPKPLQLTQTAPEIFNFANMLIENQQTISGVNAVARGNAPASLSGAAMALLNATALQFSSGVQQAFVELVEDVGTDVIHMLAEFATVPRIAYIVGKHNRSMMRSFKGDDVSQISRVTVDSANALTKSISGRVEIAQQLLQAGMIERPHQFLGLIQTGSLENLYENETSQLILMKSENEALAEGRAIQALILDDHQKHILEHSSVLASPEARQDAAIVQNTLAHIQQHIDLSKTLDPMLAQILKQAPPPQAPGPAIPQAMDASVEQVQDTPMPQMPVNPATGARFEPGVA